MTCITRQSRLPDLTRQFGPSNSFVSSRARHFDFGFSPDSDAFDTTMDPPACVQNAMMKQDKKPFTYTPGGIDLSEVRSPRMQRRIERNANLAGAGESPKPPPQSQNVGPLPPSALAAMRPQTQVQVFPQPPPPPPMKNIPPPPPPPTCPLPTQKVTTSDNLVLERPDMTKIIPDNPMALLRKTGGPAPRPSMVDAVQYPGPPSPPNKYQPPVVDRQTAVPPPNQQPQYQYSPPQRQIEAQSPRWQPQQQSTPPVQQVQQQFQAPPPPQRDLGGQSPRWPQNQTTQQQQPSRPVSQTFEPPKPSYQPPVIERQPINQQSAKVNSNVGSLYIPPVNQNAQQTQRVASPPTPPQREAQAPSPGTPTLREAPRPWQSKGGQQQELPPWARRDDEVENNQLPSQVSSQNNNFNHQQPRWPQQPTQEQQQQQQQTRSAQPVQQQYLPKTPPAQQQGKGHPGSQGHPGGFPIHIEIRAVPYPPQSQEPEEKKPNAVYVTQPLVLQHSGGQGGVRVVNPPSQPAQSRSPQPSQNQQSGNQPRQNNVYQKQQVRQTTNSTKQESGSTRIIPIQIEQTPPSTPNDSVSFNRQRVIEQSFQSNSAKTESSGTRVIPIEIEIGPNERSLNRQLSWSQNPTQSNKFKVIQKITQTDDDLDDDTPITQHSARFTQEMPEQFKGMKISNGDRFKQGIKRIDEENPRYRGGHIPSRIFKMLDESVPQQSQGNGSSNAHQSAQNHEGNGQPQKYVHPSEQTVPEPKKYMGGNIPSRSFKILQAMTAPENCANVNNNEDLTYNYPMYPPCPYPPYYPPPYWHDYYSQFYSFEQSEPQKFKETKSINGRLTPLLAKKTKSSPQPSRSITPSFGGRTTPLPIPPPPPMYPSFWGYQPPLYQENLLNSDSELDIKTCSSTSQLSGRTTPNIGGRTTPLPIPPPPMYPSPVWGYPRNYQESILKADSESDIKTCSSTESVPQQKMHQAPMYYPPYVDPYYYYYYHGYPPMPSSYYYYPTASDSEYIQSGYESSEELAGYNKNNSRKRRNSLDNGVQNVKKQFEVRCQSATPRIAVTHTNQKKPLEMSNNIAKTDALEEKDYEPKSVHELRQQFESKRKIPVEEKPIFRYTNVQENKSTGGCQSPILEKSSQNKEELSKINEHNRLTKIPEPPCTSPVEEKPTFLYSNIQDIENTDALQEKFYDKMAQSSDELPKQNELRRLRSINSLHNITTYESENFFSETDSSDDEQSSEDEEHSVPEIEEDEILPDQLSVIFEESERTDSRALRPGSAMTDASTINENSDEDSFTEAFTISHNLTVNVTQESRSSHSTTLKVGDNFIQAFKEESQTCASFALKSPSRSPRKQSPCRIEEGLIETRTQTSSFVAENGKVVVNEKTCNQESYVLGKGFEDNHKSDVTIEEITENESNLTKDLKNTDISGVVFRKKRGRQAVDSPKQTSDNESDKDFWQILGKDKESPISSRSNSTYYGYDDSPKTTRTSSVIYKDSPTDTRTNSTVYDELKETESPPNTSGNGKLMDMDSFVTKLEELKRNSGLWDLDDTDFTKDPKHVNLLENTRISKDSNETKDDEMFKSTNKNKLKNSLVRKFSDTTISNEFKEEKQTVVDKIGEKATEIDSIKPHFESVEETGQCFNLTVKTIENRLTNSNEAHILDHIDTSTEEDNLLRIVGEKIGDKTIEKHLIKPYIENLKDTKQCSNLTVKIIDKSLTNSNEAQNLDHIDTSTKEDNLLEQNITVENKSTEISDEVEKASEHSDESVDFWSQIRDDEDDFQPKRKSIYATYTPESKTNLSTETAIEENNFNNISSSACSRHSSFSREGAEIFNKSEVNNLKEKNQSEEENMVRAEISLQDEEINKNKTLDQTKTEIINKDVRDLPEPQSIKERIEALKTNSLQKKYSQEIADDIQVCVKNKISALETPNGTTSTSKTTSTKSSVKSFDEYSDEDVDSGVNSDLSRHISDNEEFPELKKLTRYERAATHSRLFKLLQEEYEEEESEDQTNFEKEVVVDKFAKLSVRNRGEQKISPSRSKLNLNLNKCNEEEEPLTQQPVNEKLADELVQSILKRRKGQIFRNMPKEKIYAAAIKILQEDAESVGTPSEEFSSLLSPLRGDTESSSPAQTPQEFYNEYMQYYNSWNMEDDSDLIPSKAFKLLQEHISASKLGTIEGFLAKCPRILSSKDIPKELTKLLEENDCSSRTLSPESQTTNDVTNTS